MSKHDHHSHCDHSLKFCDRCDAVYCAKCSREWAPPCQKYHGWQITYSNPNTGIPFGTYSSGSATATVGYADSTVTTTNACAHGSA